MVMAAACCRRVGLLLCLFSFGRVMPGVIEIVEELSCADKRLRLTCRGLDTHIAVLEAWFTAERHLPLAPPPPRHPPTGEPRADLLDQVYVYSSPRRDGLYEPEEPTPAVRSAGAEANGTLANSTVLDTAANKANGTLDDIVGTTSDVIDGANGVWDGSNKVVGATSDVVGGANGVWDGSNNVVGATSDVVNGTSDVVEETSECSVPRFQNSYPSSQASENIRDGVWFSPNVSINLRNQLSYRCTGVNHCSFLLSADYAAAAAAEGVAAEREARARGALYIKYACFDDAHSTRFCNREVNAAGSGPASEGYIRTPGYPQYYVGEARCLWKLRAPEGQQLRLTLVDVSLRSIGPFEEECTDHVSARDAVHGYELLSTCVQRAPPLRVQSRSHAIDVLIETRSEGAFPKRGVLMHYKSIGCVTPPAPRDGYLVYRERRVARYACDVGAVFADTRQRARALACVDDNRWNDTVPECVVEGSAPASGAAGSSGVDHTPAGTSSSPKMTSTDRDYIVDVVIPSLLIVALFIGNAFIVLIIYKYRKRKTDDAEEEFNTIPLSHNGSALHAAGNAV